MNTSNTDYRRNYITTSKKFFERLRVVYERELRGKGEGKKEGKKEGKEGKKRKEIPETPYF